jgi:hypothetical protein
MARKRVIKIEEKGEPKSHVNDNGEGLRSPAKDVGWVVWLKGTYLKYWYAVGCFFIDTLLALELPKAHYGSAISAVLLLVFLLLIAAQVYVYMQIWRKPGKQK